MRKRPVGSCRLAWLLTVVSKDSFEGSRAGLFAGNNANKSDVCAILFAETSEKKRTYGLADGSEDTDKSLVQFAERIEGKLATFDA